VIFSTPVTFEIAVANGFILPSRIFWRFRYVLDTSALVSRRGFLASFLLPAFQTAFQSPPFSRRFHSLM
jgi:hypothetical protein